MEFVLYICSFTLLVQLAASQPEGTSGAACEGISRAHVGMINRTLVLWCRRCNQPGGEVKWYLEGDSVPLTDVTVNGSLLVPVHEDTSERRYRCNCAGRQDQCHIILVSPYFRKFHTRGPAFVRSGDDFTLVCEASGYPKPQLENFAVTKPSTPSIYFQQQDLTFTGSGVAVTVTNASKERHSGSYHCIVNTQFSMGQIHHSLQSGVSTTVTVYEPPAIISINNSTVYEWPNTTSDAVLKCIVKRGDGAVRIEWTRDNVVLQRDSNYLTPEPTTVVAGVLLYLLIVQKPTEDDFQIPFECRLYSNYTSELEAVELVWINLRQRNISESADDCKCVSDAVSLYIPRYAIISVTVAVIVVLLLVISIGATVMWKRFKK